MVNASDILERLETASDILKRLETVTFSHFKGYAAQLITDAFSSKLVEHGYEGIEVRAGFTLSSGISVDLKLDGVQSKVYFNLGDEGPVAVVLPNSESTLAVTINLSDFEPPVALELNAPDLLDLSWITKDLIDSIISSSFTELSDAE